MAEVVAVFADAARTVALLLHDPRVATAWDEPSALAGYRVGGLAAHLLTAVARLEEVLDAPPPDGPLASMAEYYGANRIDQQDSPAEAIHAFLVADGERRAEAGPATIAAAFDGLVERLAAKLAAAPADRAVPVVRLPGSVAPLGDYVVTRLIELVVHADDLCVSVGIDPACIPEPAMSQCVDALMTMARRRVGELITLRALARAERAPADALRVL